MAVDKSKRYDRGIRVWGAHGQEALEAAKVCLLNAGPTGTEALKNLVLGGIHSFTIVDGAKVTPADLGNNFLLTADALGTSRARCATGAPAVCAAQHASCLTRLCGRWSADMAVVL
jgi:amyloid beta precursor protein binding protein 1